MLIDSEPHLHQQRCHPASRTFVTSLDYTKDLQCLTSPITADATVSPATKPADPQATSIPVSPPQALHEFMNVIHAYNWMLWPNSLYNMNETANINQLGQACLTFKGIVQVFEVGSYKVHIYSQSVPYHNHWSAHPQFREAERCSSPDAQLCSAVNGVQMQCEF